MSINSNLEKTKIHGFSYLKAFACLAVVATHLFLNFEDCFNLNQTAIYVFNVLFYNVFLLAVPIFFQISLFLFFFNHNFKEDYFLKRLIKLSSLFLFWTISLSLFRWILHRNFEYPLPTVRALNFSSISSIIQSILSANNTPFYFLISLIILTIFAEYLAKYYERFCANNFLNNKNLISNIVLLFASVSLITILPFLIVYGYKIELQWMVSTWNPVNFFPYIFTAYLLYIQFNSDNKFSNKIPITILIILILLNIFTIIIEWQFLGIYDFWDKRLITTYNLPPYSRISLVLTSYIITYCGIKYLPSQPPKIIEILANNSLPIYCFHYFLVYLAVQFISRKYWFLGEIEVIFISIILVCLLLANLLKKVRFLNQLI